MMKFALCMLVCFAAGCAGGVTQIKTMKDIHEVTLVEQGQTPVSICVKQKKSDTNQTCYELSRDLFTRKYGR